MLQYQACILRKSWGINMARITIEDCLKKIDNRFDLVLMAAKRAFQISKHYQVDSTHHKEGDKPAVAALREIEYGDIDAATVDKLHEDLQDKLFLEQERIRNEKLQQSRDVEAPTT